MNRFSRLLACITGTSHLPARGQSCPLCHESGHLWCRTTSGPDIEHIAMELDAIERRTA